MKVTLIRVVGMFVAGATVAGTASAQVSIRAPFVRVETGWGGTYVRAPFVRLWTGGPPPVYYGPPPGIYAPQPLIPGLQFQFGPSAPAPLPTPLQAPAMQKPAVPLPPAPMPPADPKVVPPVDDFQPPAPAQVPAAPTLQEFAKSFQPRPGNFEISLLNPTTQQPTTVRFSLPAGTPQRVLTRQNQIEFVYGPRQFVRIEFDKDGAMVSSR